MVRRGKPDTEVDTDMETKVGHSNIINIRGAYGDVVGRGRRQIFSQDIHMRWQF